MCYIHNIKKKKEYQDFIMEEGNMREMSLQRGEKLAVLSTWICKTYLSSKFTKAKMKAFGEERARKQEPMI